VSRIHNLYTHLITNRRSDVDGWLDAYTAFTKEVTKVRAALKQGHRVHDPATYGETAFGRSTAEFNRSLLERLNGQPEVAPVSARFSRIGSRDRAVPPPTGNAEEFSTTITSGYSYGSEP